MEEPRVRKKYVNLTGKKFGHLTALHRSQVREDRFWRWECKCDCGGSINVSTKKLQRGTITNCGCIPKTTKRNGSIAEDLTGQRFGKLTVIRREPSKNGRVRWYCTCDCGGSRIATAHNLKVDGMWNCGCESNKGVNSNVDLSGQRYGRLTALFPTEDRDKKGSIIWRCRCDCGEERDVTADALRSGNTTSCGCRKKEVQSVIGDTLNFVDGTCIEWIRKPRDRSDNTSGFRGVSFSCGRYRTTIGFKGKRYNLGTYETFDEAKRVRVEAEKLVFTDFVTLWEKYTEKAAIDPSWAEENPLVFEVYKRNGELVIAASPKL